MAIATHIIVLRIGHMNSIKRFLASYRQENSKTLYVNVLP